MNYRNHYDLLMDKAKNRLFESDHYRERHHIIPRCMGGSDEPENIVELTPEEHYVAHQLLVKIYPDHKGLVWAALQLAGGKNKNGGNRSNNKVYGWLKRKNSKKVSKQSKERWENIEFRNKMCESISKATKEKWKDEKYRKKIVEANKKRWKHPEYRKKMKTASKEYWSDPENRREASKQRKGEKNGSYGSHWYHNPETRESIRCKPEEAPVGYVKGKTPKPNNKCQICNADTSSRNAKYCDIHRKDRKRELVKSNFENVDLGGYRRKATEEDIKNTLINNDYDVSKAMKSLGYLTIGGNTRRRFEKILDSMLTSL